MPSCLGIYFNEDTIKYAKLVMDNSGNVRLDHYGTRIAKGGRKDVVDNIIDETSSREIPIVTNVTNESFTEVSIFDQAQESQYSPDIMKMEFQSWCETNQKNIEKFDYVYKLSKYRTSENKHNGVLCIVPKEKLAECSQLNDIKAKASYPAKLLYTELPPEEIQNYIIVNLDEQLTIETVINRKMFDYKFYNVGMKNIIKGFEEKLGSYQRAYTACKQLNVYTEGESTNDKELEKIAEPILQEILRNVASVVTVNKDTISRIYITGIGMVLNNIDVLFTEYLDTKTEILKPNFLEDTSDIRNVSEMLETTQPMAMAYKYLQGKSKFLNYLHTEEEKSKKNVFEDLMLKIKGNVSFKKKSNKTSDDIKDSRLTASIADNKIKDTKVATKQEQKINIELPKLETNVVLNVLVGFATFAVVVFIAYMSFTIIYTKSTNKMIGDINTKINLLTTETAKVNSDVTYIQTNTIEYTEINDDVDLLVSQIESGEIGKISTYNVATFLQKIIKVIPKNLTLDTVKSDDNKNVTITMYAEKYADLGYFVAQLKLQGILNSVEVKNIENTADKITIEIGGELP